VALYISPVFFGSDSNGADAIIIDHQFRTVSWAMYRGCQYLLSQAQDLVVDSSDVIMNGNKRFGRGFDQERNRFLGTIFAAALQQLSVAIRIFLSIAARI